MTVQGSGGHFPILGGDKNLMKAKAHDMQNLHWTISTNIVLKGKKVVGRLQLIKHARGGTGN